MLAATGQVHANIKEAHLSELAAVSQEIGEGLLDLRKALQQLWLLPCKGAQRHQPHTRC